MRSFMRVLTVLTLIFAVAAISVAQTREKPKGGKPAPEDMQKMMEEMMKTIKPGPQHDILAKMAGDWVVNGKMWRPPSTEAMLMKPGTEHAEMILGGRYLQSVNQGEMMGMPFEGHGMMGFDNFRKEYQMTWVDNMGTTISTAAGTADPTGKVITLMGKMDEPSTGEKDKDVKYVYTFKDDKTVVLEMYDSISGKGFFKIMEMTYTRK